MHESAVGGRGAVPRCCQSFPVWDAQPRPQSWICIVQRPCTAAAVRGARPPDPQCLNLHKRKELTQARPLLDPSAMRSITWPSCSAFQCIPSKKPAVSNAALCSVRRAVRHGKIAKEGSFSLLDSPEHSQYKQGKDEKFSPAAEEPPRHRCHVWPWQAWCHRPAQNESPVTSDLRPSSDTSLVALLDIA